MIVKTKDCKSAPAVTFSAGAEGGPAQEKEKLTLQSTRQVSTDLITKQSCIQFLDIHTHTPLLVLGGHLSHKQKLLYRNLSNIDYICGLTTCLATRLVFDVQSMA